MQEAYLIKVLLCGSANVGKTAIIQRTVEHQFSENTASTIGIDFRTLNIGDDISFQIWDTAGQERFQSMSRQIYRGSHVFIFVYDVCNRATFDALYTKIFTDAAEFIGSAFCYILGNKIDKEARQVTYEEGSEFAHQNKMSFMETSAASGKGLETIFSDIAQAIRITIKANEGRFTRTPVYATIDSVPRITKMRGDCCK